MSDQHSITRTSPKGEAFVGTCMKCGKTGLTLKDMQQECDNPSRMTQDEALIAAIWDEARIPFNQVALAHAETLACDRYAKLTGDVMPFAMRETIRAALTAYLRLMSGASL